MCLLQHGLRHPLLRAVSSAIFLDAEGRDSMVLQQLGAAFRIDYRIPNVQTMFLLRISTLKLYIRLSLTLLMFLYVAMNPRLDMALPLRLRNLLVPSRNSSALSTSFRYTN